jgi:nucleoside transporter
MNSAIRYKLILMMFLEYLIWGAWFPLLNNYIGPKYLNFDWLQGALVNDAFAIMSLTAIFFGGQLADRYFSQEKFLAFSLLVSGVALLGLTFAQSFWPFFGLMMLYSFFYVPTLSVTNAIAFANLKDAQKEFGLVRVGGTLGWIAAAWPFVFLPIHNLFTVAGIAALVTAAYCLTLPSTPPVKSEGATFAPLKALRLLSVPTILVLFIVTFIDSLVHNCYFITSGPFYEKLGLPERWISAAMSIGQIAEIATMAALGFFLKRLGWRTTMIIGVLGHVVRFGIYALGGFYGGQLWLGLIVLSNVVHGFAYAFFFATVYIFVDENFPKDVRTSAQSLFNLLILGLGPFVGGFLWKGLEAAFSTKVDGKISIDYTSLFLVPLVLGLISTAILALFFHPPAKEPVPEEVPLLVN